MMKVDEAVLNNTVKAYTNALIVKINHIEHRATRYHLNEETKVYPSHLKELENLLNEFELFLHDNNLTYDDKD